MNETFKMHQDRTTMLRMKKLNIGPSLCYGDIQSLSIKKEGWVTKKKASNGLSAERKKEEQEGRNKNRRRRRREHLTLCWLGGFSL